MSVCLCVSAYMSLRWEEEERWQPGPAGQVELRNGQAVLPSPSLCWLHRTCIPTPSTAAPALPAGASPFRVPTSPACLGSVCVGGAPPAHPPWPWASSPTLSGPSGHWGGLGEALKAGDCLGELGDRAPIVPAPEPPQWSSLAQKGFDNG